MIHQLKKKEKEKMMLSKDTIKKAINDGIITFVADPTAESGTVCKIGNNWFYFGGQTAEQYNPNDYLKYANIDDIVNSIYEVLDEFSKLDMFHDEYLYYEAYITHNLKVKNDTITVEADNIDKAEYDILLLNVDMKLPWSDLLQRVKTPNLSLTDAAALYGRIISRPINRGDTNV